MFTAGSKAETMTGQSWPPLPKCLTGLGIILSCCLATSCGSPGPFLARVILALSLKVQICKRLPQDGE
jgi:hypothetical protein